MLPTFLLAACGWLGAVAIVGAYALVSFEILKPTSFWFQFFNLTGALGIIINAVPLGDYPTTALNAFWALVALVALCRLAKGRWHYTITIESK